MPSRPAARVPRCLALTSPVGVVYELEFDAPFLGEHNQALLTGYLGYSQQDVARLTEQGVLHNANY